MKDKFGSILLSVAIAFGLWLYVITAVSPGSRDTYYNIPVVMSGESVLAERGLMITSVSSSSVTLELSGNRSDLSRVNKDNITVKADVSQIYEPGVHALSYTYSFPGTVASNAFVVESKSPEKLVFTVERRLSKDVPVEIRWIGSAPEGFMSDRENRVLDFPVVNISGPESVVSQIEKAVIEVDLNEQRESISQDYLYTLCDANDSPVNAELVVTNVEQVHLDVKIQRVKDVALTYTLVEGGGADINSAQITLSVDTIRVSGSEAALDNLGDEIVIGVINLEDISKNTALTFNLVLPEGITNLTGVTEVVADVRLNGLATREFTIQEFGVMNIPEGMKVELITKELVLVVRGPSAQIAMLTPGDIAVTVDFSSAEIGTSTFRTVVTFAEGFEGVGALRMDTVSASVTAEK